jgi:hypothetical protein
MHIQSQYEYRNNPNINLLKLIYRNTYPRSQLVFVKLPSGFMIYYTVGNNLYAANTSLNRFNEAPVRITRFKIPYLDRINPNISNLPSLPELQLPAFNQLLNLQNTQTI